MIVAAEHAEAEGAASRQDMKERLLFDRVNLQSGNVAVRHHQCAVLIEADFADSFMARRDPAPVAAGNAGQPGIAPRPWRAFPAAHSAQEQIAQRISAGDAIGSCSPCSATSFYVLRYDAPFTSTIHPVS